MSEKMLIKQGNIHNAIEKEAFVADFVILKGNPFAVDTRIFYTIINGKIAYSDKK